MGEQKFHPGEAPFRVNSFRKALVSIYQQSGIAPVVCALILREFARTLDDQSEYQAADYKRTIEKQQEETEKPKNQKKPCSNGKEDTDG